MEGNNIPWTEFTKCWNVLLKRGWKQKASALGEHDHCNVDGTTKSSCRKSVKECVEASLKDESKQEKDKAAAEEKKRKAEADEAAADEAAKKKVEQEKRTLEQKKKEMDEKKMREERARLKRLEAEQARAFAVAAEGKVGGGKEKDVREEAEKKEEKKDVSECDAMFGDDDLLDDLEEDDLLCEEEDDTEALKVIQAAVAAFAEKEKIAIAASLRKAEEIAELSSKTSNQKTSEETKNSTEDMNSCDDTEEDDPDETEENADDAKPPRDLKETPKCGCPGDIKQWIPRRKSHCVDAIELKKKEIQMRAKKTMCFVDGNENTAFASFAMAVGGKDLHRRHLLQGHWCSKDAEAVLSSVDASRVSKSSSSSPSAELKKALDDALPKWIDGDLILKDLPRPPPGTWNCGSAKHAKRKSLAPKKFSHDEHDKDKKKKKTRRTKTKSSKNETSKGVEETEETCDDDQELEDDDDYEILCDDDDQDDDGGGGVSGIIERMEEVRKLEHELHKKKEKERMKRRKEAAKAREAELMAEMKSLRLKLEEASGAFTLHMTSGNM